MRIYRREQGKQAATKDQRREPADCGTQPASQLPEFLDQTFEWEKHYDYRATVVTVVSASGKPRWKSKAKTLLRSRFSPTTFFLPRCPPDLQAVFSGVGQAPFVDLVWSPDTEADLAGYNIFRHEANGPPVKLNSEPVKTPAFRDSKVQSGRKYFYSISAVDERNNESAKSEEASEQVP